MELSGTPLDDRDRHAMMLGEVWIAADTETLRQLARFLQNAADEFDRWGEGWDDDHYSLFAKREFGIEYWGGDVTVVHPRYATRDDLGDPFLASLPPLVRAARLGDGAAVTELLAIGHDANDADADGFTALEAASQVAAPNLVRRLLSAGADVNAGSFGETPLMAAAGFGHAEIVEMLLASGADVHAISDEPTPETALDQAAGGGHAGIVGRLLELGVDVEGADDEITPLMNAAELGHLETIRVLLDAGADPFRTYKGETSLDLARRKGHNDVAELLERAMRE
jgi:ankyrin repeat protein